MNLTVQGRQFNPEILSAYFQVVQVRSQLQALLPRARAAGSVTVGETQLRQWIATLESANAALGRVPIILIFPPPPVATFINTASTLLESAIGILNAIPIASLTIFPPQPGQATISLQTLQSLINILQLVEQNLLAALMA